MECKHTWRIEEYRDNQYRLIQIFWCEECGALKRLEIMQGGEKKEIIKLPKRLLEK